MSERLDQIEKILLELSISQKKMDVHLLELKEAQLKTDAQIAELREAQLKTDAQLAKTDAQIEKLVAEGDKARKTIVEIGRQLGEIGHSSGDVTESFFMGWFLDHPFLGQVHFDEVSQNIKQKRQRLEDEYDIFLENKSAVGIVEVKYKVAKKHVDQVLQKKDKFWMLFPDYKKRNLYLGIAGFAFERGVELYAMKKGLVVLKQKGEAVELNTQKMTAYTSAL